MAIITYKDLHFIRERHKNEKIVFCSGCFDLTHAGHALFFEDCKKYGDILVVAVGCDATTRHVKGEARPILNEHMRLKMVDSLKPVDYCFLDRPTPPGKFVVVPAGVLDTLKPNVYAINDDASDMEYRKSHLKKFTTQLVVLKREAPPEYEGISTTKIIQKIKNL